MRERIQRQTQNLKALVTQRVEEARAVPIQMPRYVHGLFNFVYVAETEQCTHSATCIFGLNSVAIPKGQFAQSTTDIKEKLTQATMQLNLVDSDLMSRITAMSDTVTAVKNNLDSIIAVNNNNNGQRKGNAALHEVNDLLDAV